jgi:hypothetical protein
MRHSMPGALASALVVGGLVGALAGCDDESTSPEPTPFNITLAGVPRLGTGQYYEAWVAFPEEAGRAMHGDDVRVSLGQFKVNQAGDIEGLEGGPVSFEFSGDQDLGTASYIFVTVETAGDTARGPALLAGPVEGDDNQGRASLLVSDHHAAGTDFATAAGSFILATPTNGLGTDENQGIWFTDPSGAASLTLPTLGEGWIYHAHFYYEHSHSIGTFSTTNVEDSDGRGPEGGPQPGFNAPGSDFLASAPDLANGETEAFIVIQPAGDEHGGVNRDALHDSSFPMRVLETTIALGAPTRQSIALVARTTPWPSGSVSFDR